MDRKMMDLVCVAFALFAGGFVKGGTGVGLPMISVPLLAIVLPIEDSIALLSLPILLANLAQARGVSGELLRESWFRYLGGSLLIGMAVSVIFLTENPRWLVFMAAVSIVMFALISLAGVQLKIRSSLRSPVALFTGCFAGLVGGSTATYGWPLVMYLSSITLNSAQFISTISFLYLFAHTGFLISLLLRDLLSLNILMGSAFACVPVFIGIRAGRWLTIKIVRDKSFYKLVCLLMLAGGVSLMLRA